MLSKMTSDRYMAKGPDVGATTPEDGPGPPHDGVAGERLEIGEAREQAGRSIPDHAHRGDSLDAADR